MNRIGQLNEQPLHNALKRYYAGMDGQMEVQLDGYHIDVVLDGQLIEIQTGNFAAIRRKLKALVQNHPVRLVYPVAQEKWLVKMPKAGTEGVFERRKSPKTGQITEVFNELVSIPALLGEPNFSLEVALIREEQLREYHEGRHWRQKGWQTVERRLLDVIERRTFLTTLDIVEVLPKSLSDTFTTADLAEMMGISRSLAQKTAYCLREMGALEPFGKRGRAVLYLKKW
ncbi:MAG: hypothetical protein H0S82_08080 [Anaerolineaceae bacterium]|nr:hypothetical protein [Anaerolineaceae bacterium]